jgi:hypothetical protein
MEYEMTTPAGDSPGTGESQAPGTGGNDQQNGQPQQQTNQGDGGEGEGEGEGTGTATRTAAQEAAFWKQQSRKHEDRAKANADAAKRLKTFEDSQKTALQLAEERAVAAEQRSAAADAERHRLLAAATHGLTPDLVDFLGMGTEAEIFGRAEVLNTQIDAAVNARLTQELAKYGISPAAGEPSGSPSAGAAASLSQGRRPVTQLRSGNGPAPQSSAVNGDKNAAFRGMLGGR